MSELRKIDIHQSINKPIAVLGGDREMTLMLILLAVAAGMIGMTWYTITAAIIILISGIIVLQKAFKLDPQFRFVYLKQIKYKRYYSAMSHPQIDKED
jgi:type IV secretion system protein VirB3